MVRALRFSLSAPVPDCNAELAEAAAEAYSDSFSPIQLRANHRPPAMPRTSRCACRQCRTFFPLLSSGTTGAKPDPIFCGGCTAGGFDGRGYKGNGIPSRSISSGTEVGKEAEIEEAEGAGAMEMVLWACKRKSIGSRLCSSCPMGDEAAAVGEQLVCRGGVRGQSERTFAD